MKKEVAIIGAGVGGLFLGAILATEGFKVTIFEKNSTIGGGLQSFRRFGEVFDTGMHIIGGMRPGENIYRICQYLGINNEVRIMDTDKDCSAVLYFGEDRKVYEIPSGRRNFINRLAGYFPAERENLERYVDAFFRLSEEADLFYLRPSNTFIPAHSAEFTQSATSFIAKYIKDPKLRSILAYMNPLYGGKKDKTPAFIHALINVLYINGSSRFVGGSMQFAGLLAKTIRNKGGEIVVNEGIRKIEVTQRTVTDITTTTGRTFTADYYVSAIHPCSLLKLMDEDAFPKAFRGRMNEIPNSYSAFSLYIKLKPDTFPFINHSEFYMNHYDEIWNFDREDKPWPLGFLMMTPPEENQGQYSRKVLVTAPMTFDKVRQWEDTVTGHRDQAYEDWKRHCTELILDQIENIHPGFRQYIMNINAASPLTIRDYYNVKEGAMCGFSKDCNNLALSQLPVVTKIRNLLLTGQNNNLHGFCGVPLTAINTAEAILGKNYIINKINNITSGETKR